jgi:hypothetical protein
VSSVLSGTVVSRTPGLRRAVAVIVLAALAWWLGSTSACGGQGHEAPHVIGAREDTGCPSADAALARTRRALGVNRGGDVRDDARADDGLAELRPHLVRVLIEEGGLRVLILAATAILADTDPLTTQRLVSGVNPEEGFGRLTRHLVEVLRYIDGSSAYSPDPHLEPLAAIHAIMNECEAARTIATVRGIIRLEVKGTADGPVLAAPGEGERTWLNAVLLATKEVLDDPALAELFERIELDAPDGSPGAPGTIRVGRDAFVLLAQLLAANLAAPDFDPAFTRQLLERVLLSRVADENARARVSALLDVLVLVTDPASEVFPQVQSFMQCVDGADAEAAIPGLLYDWLTIEELSLDEALDDVSSSTGTDSAEDLRLALVEVLGALEARPRLTADVARVLARFFDEPTAPVLVRTALAVRGKGVFAEIAGLADAVAACQPEAGAAR